MSLKDIGVKSAQIPTIDEILQHSASAAVMRQAEQMREAEQAVGAAAAQVGLLSWDWLQQASASGR